MEEEGDVLVDSSGGAAGAALTACEPSTHQPEQQIPCPAPGVRNYGYPDEFMMYAFKVELCTRQEKHPRGSCPYAHPGDVARRRHPSRYQALLCPEVRAKKVCPRMEDCQCSHSAFEFWLHPDRYRTNMCEKGFRCSRPVCFFAHTPEELRPLPDGLKPAAPEDANNGRASSSGCSSLRPQQQRAGLILGAPGMISLAPMQYVQHPVLLQQPQQPPGAHMPGMVAGGAAAAAPAGFAVAAAVPNAMTLQYNAGPGRYAAAPEHHGSAMLTMRAGQQQYVMQHEVPAGAQHLHQHQHPQLEGPRQVHPQPPQQLPDMLHQFQQLGFGPSAGGYASYAADAGVPVQPLPPPQAPQVVQQASQPMAQQQQAQVMMVASGTEHVQQGRQYPPHVSMPAASTLVSMPAASTLDAPGRSWVGVPQPPLRQPYPQQSAYRPHQQHAAVSPGYAAGAPYSMAVPHSAPAGSAHLGSGMVLAAPVGAAALAAAAGTPSSAGQLLQHPGSASLLGTGSALPALLPGQQLAQPSLPSPAGSVGNSLAAGVGGMTAVVPMAHSPAPPSSSSMTNEHHGQLQ